MALFAKQIELGGLYEAMINNQPYKIGTYKLAEIQERILKWNLTRNNINFDEDIEINMYAEEDLEYEIAFDEENIEAQIDALCDKYVVFTGTLAKSGLSETGFSPELITYFEDYKVIPKTVKSLGYCFRKCMDECLKHIESRQQDPVQALDWEINGASGKWQKDLSQDPATIYQPDYASCLDCKDCNK